MNEQLPQFYRLTDSGVKCPSKVRSLYDGSQHIGDLIKACLNGKSQHKIDDLYITIYGIAFLTTEKQGGSWRHAVLDSFFKSRFKFVKYKFFMTEHFAFSQVTSRAYESSRAELFKSLKNIGIILNKRTSKKVTNSLENGIAVKVEIPEIRRCMYVTYPDVAHVQKHRESVAGNPLKTAKSSIQNGFDQLKECVENPVDRAVTILEIMDDETKNCIANAVLQSRTSEVDQIASPVIQPPTDQVEGCNYSNVSASIHESISESPSTDDIVGGVVDEFQQGLHTSTSTSTSDPRKMSVPPPSTAGEGIKGGEGEQGSLDAFSSSTNGINEHELGTGGFFRNCVNGVKVWVYCLSEIIDFGTWDLNNNILSSFVAGAMATNMKMHPLYQRICLWKESQTLLHHRRRRLSGRSNLMVKFMIAMHHLHPTIVITEVTMVVAEVVAEVTGTSQRFIHRTSRVAHASRKIVGYWQCQRGVKSMILPRNGKVVSNVQICEWIHWRMFLICNEDLTIPFCLLTT